MDNHSFWQDFFDTYQSLSDWMKFAWLIVPPAFILGLIVMRFKTGSKRTCPGRTGELVYSIHRDNEDRFHIVSHVPQVGGQPTLLLLGQPNRDPHAPQRTICASAK